MLRDAFHQAARAQNLISSSSHFPQGIVRQDPLDIVEQRDGSVSAPRIRVRTETMREISRSIPSKSVVRAKDYETTSVAGRRNDREWNEEL